VKFKDIAKMSQEDLFSCWPTGPFNLAIAKMVIDDCTEWDEWQILMQWLKEKRWS
jgi:hypothetical protein